MRLLFFAAPPWANTGYGVQVRSLLPRLAALPEIGGFANMALFWWNGAPSGTYRMEGLRIYPAGRGNFCNDIIGAHAHDFGADVVLSLIDVWVMKDTASKVKPALWIPWFPMEHDPIPEAVINALQGVHLALPLSKWAQQMLNGAGIANEYMPHGIESDIYRVLSDQNAVADFKRETLHVPDGGHLTVMVAANYGYPDRKAFQVQLRAWAKFAADKPNARLYLHTELSTIMGGLDLNSLLGSLGILDKTSAPDSYQYQNGYSADFMAFLYNSADVYLGAAMAEGFGVPIIEAQACGVPVIVTNFSAMPELVHWGMAVEPLDLFWTPLNAWNAWPDVSGITAALNELHSQWEANGCQWPLAQRLQAQEAIHSDYAWDVLARDYWAPLMTKLAAITK